MPKKDFPLNAYWRERSWRRFEIYNHVSMQTIIACLGLVCRRVLHVGLVLDHATGTALQVEVGRIALQLSEQLDIEDMAECAANPNFLNQEIDELFDKFASRLWGQDANRRLLMAPGSDVAYPKHLVYEDDADRKLLWIHLHRWIFASAVVLLRFNKPNSRIPPPKSSKKKRSDSVHADDNADTCVSTGVPSVAQKQYVKRGKQLYESIEDQQPRKRTKTEEFTDVPLPVRNKPLPTPNVGRIRRRILGYLDAYGQADFDEVSALEGMAKELDNVASLLKGPPFPHAFPAVFDAWLTYRYTVLAVKLDASAPHSQKLSDMDAKVKRMRLVTALRVARDDFMATGRDKATPASAVMVKGIAGLAKAEGKDARDFVKTVKSGFEKLDAQLAELAASIGDKRRGKWVVSMG